MSSTSVEDFLGWMVGSYKKTTLTYYKCLLNDIDEKRNDLNLPPLEKLNIRELGRVRTMIETESPTKWYVDTFLLKKFYSWAGNDLLSKQIPIPKYTIIRKERIALPQDKVDKIIQNSGGYQNMAMLQTAYDLALRVTEVTLLDRSSLFFDSGTCLVKRLKSHRELYVTHELPISQKTMDLLKVYLNDRGNTDDETALFVRGRMGRQRRTKKYRRINRMTVQNVFNRAVGEAGLERDDDKGRRITFHTLRHSRLTSMAMDGADIVQIAKFAGHRSTDSALVYVHLAGEMLRTRMRTLQEAKPPTSPAA